ncbi:MULTISPECIES: permease [Pseudomonas syringae group]|uniref:Permease n=6 Tax=Pseudomonas syringae group TaxID=136849 RepID=A0AAD0E3B0_9PSED|nr:MULTISPECIES: permease [Pseudomonas syringae group]AVB21268.1 permease [Pseudomonas avellanae]POC87952.1 permease [Pseudomonas avellanae]POD05914.1 permease [Pseudomonas avellanae]POD19669.1 permease [Pseudomonas avellanae]POP87390.1 permease [Pseudomonas amygdali pv. morsprunorum]
MTQLEKALDLPKGKDILNWKIKTLARSPREIMIAQSIFAAIHLTGSSLFIWGGWKVFLKNPPLLVGLILALGGVLAYFTGLLIRQKTIYNYTLKTDGATVEYYLHYPDFASSFFKGIAIAVILIFVFIALLTGSLLFLIGPVAMAFIAAVKLLNWENPVHHRQTAPWHLHEFVTVDHKRLMVITHCDDVTTGFAARFPSKELMAKYLAFLHEVLPPSAEYIEKASNWK